MIFSGSKEIAAAIKEDYRRINYLVKHEGLPAWKRDGTVGPWKALPEDLEIWVREQRRKYGPGV